MIEKKVLNLGFASKISFAQPPGLKPQQDNSPPEVGKSETEDDGFHFATRADVSQILQQIPEVEKPSSNDFELELATLEKEINDDVASKRGGFCWETDKKASIDLTVQGDSLTIFPESEQPDEAIITIPRWREKSDRYDARFHIDKTTSGGLLLQHSDWEMNERRELKEMSDRVQNKDKWSENIQDDINSERYSDLLPLMEKDAQERQAKREAELEKEKQMHANTIVGAPVSYVASPEEANVRTDSSEEEGDGEEEDYGQKFVRSKDIPSHIQTPATFQEHQVILTTTRYIKKGGLDAELKLQARQAANPKFGFLFDTHPLHKYYLYLKGLDIHGKAPVPVTRSEGGLSALAAYDSDDESSEEPPVPMSTEPPSLITTSGQKLSTKKAISLKKTKPLTDDTKKYEGDFLNTPPEVKVQKIIIHTVKNILTRGEDWMKSLMRMNKPVLAFLQPHNKDHSFYQWVTYQMKNGKQVAIQDPISHALMLKSKSKVSSDRNHKRKRSSSKEKSSKKRKKKKKKKKKEKKRKRRSSNDESEEISA